MRLGEVGRFEKGRLERKCSLLNLDITLEAEKVDKEQPEGTAEVFIHASASSVRVSAETKAEFGSLADGSVAFRFQKQGDHVLSARGLRHRRRRGLDPRGAVQASLNTDIAFSEGEFIEVRAAHATPFFMALKFEPRWLGAGSVENISTRGSDDPDPADTLRPLHFEDDLMGSWGP